MIAENLNAIVLSSAILSLFLAASVIFMLLEIRRMRKPFGEMAQFHKSSGTEKSLEKLLKGVDENREYIRGHSEEIRKIFSSLDRCYRGTGIVKFNAFEDIGGMQSYSICFLTLEKNGLILTNLVGRNSTRAYALEVKDGNPTRDLSEEEKEALAYAVKSLTQ